MEYTQQFVCYAVPVPNQELDFHGTMSLLSFLFKSLRFIKDSCCCWFYVA